MSGWLNRRPLSSRRGMTLPELLAAIMICGATGALLLPHLLSAPAPALAVGQPSYEPSSPTPDGDPTLAPEPDFLQRGFIGAALARTPTPDGFVRVRQPIPGGPADRAGLRPLDT